MSNISENNQKQQEYHLINEDNLSTTHQPTTTTTTTTINDHQEFLNNYLGNQQPSTTGSIVPTSSSINNCPIIVNNNPLIVSKRPSIEINNMMDKKKEFFLNENNNKLKDGHNDNNNNNKNNNNKNHINLVSIFDKVFLHAFSNEKIIMKYRNIGKNGLRVPILAFSAWNNFAQISNEDVAEDILSTAMQNGINYFDTGDAFGGDNGQAEILLGKILKKKRELWPRNSYIVSTKIFWKNGPSAHLGAGLSRKFIVEAVERSLARLQLNYIDIVIIHKLDAMCPMEEIVRTMAYLINKGHIFYWGTSRFSPMHIAEAFSIARQFNCPPPICEQMEYHMFNRDKMELQMLELFHKAGIGCITWSPISLQNDDGINFITRKQNKDLQPKYNELIKLCDKLQCDLTQLSLAWCLQNENVNCILITATTVSELHQKLNSIKIYPILTEMVNSEIEVILENNPVIKRQAPKTPSIQIDAVNEPEYV